MKIANPQQLETFRADLISSRKKSKRLISICSGPGCSANHSREVQEALRLELDRAGYPDLPVKLTGCHGFCEQGPLMVILPEGTLYTRVKPEDASEIVERTIKGNQLVERLVYTDPDGKISVPKEDEVPFYAKQTRVLLEHQKEIDPLNIEDYLIFNGYSALAKALFEMTSDSIVDTLKKSGLRGRGGAGFPTGQKWESVKKQANPQKYVICNADEGDPGAYMDRSLIEGNPHSIIEGMIIGAFAMGADQGYVYIREEYPLAVKNLHVAVRQAREMNLLGSDIMGSGFSFEIIIYRGAGAFVCGESSALIASIMGQPGEPRQKPPHNAEKGLWDCPTNINNVETWANVPQIINQGAAWFAGIGSKNSPGTKIFSLVGKINNTGLIEVPMGITLREIVYDIGGGIPHNRKFKAIQTGGPSGGCLPEDRLDLPVDFESLSEAGAIMGSGGMIVMDEDTCMVNIAKYFTDFNLNESCGKCTSCREGLYRLSETLARITHGNGNENDIDLLEELSEYIIDTSLCGLGTTAPYPILSTLRYFRDEYQAHIIEKRCPAKVCKPLIGYRINPGKCIGCGNCVKVCPVKAVAGEKKKAHLINGSACIKCGQCLAQCPAKVSAIEVFDCCVKVEAAL
jgi:NADH:ubiquinone oxidoreductase subunit F (NADH-binding)/(2Fe-2S) ferredoxin